MARDTDNTKTYVSDTVERVRENNKRGSIFPWSTKFWAPQKTFPPQNAHVENINGQDVIVSIDPTMIKPWRFEYYLTPISKAYAVRWMIGAGVFMIIMAALMTIIESYGPLLAFILLFLIILTTALRLSNVGFYKLAIPAIPYVNDMSLEVLMKTRVSDEPDDESGDSDTQYHYVTPVYRRIAGVDSPATLLTRWMNNPQVQMTEPDLISASNGLITQTSLDLLLADNMDEWSNPKTVRTIATITSTDPSQWSRVVENWKEIAE